MTSKRPWWLICAPVIFLLLWSGGYAVAKVGLQYTQPMTLLVMRFGLVVLVMGLAFVILRPPVPQTRGEWGHLAIVGFLIQTVYFGLSYVAFASGVAAGTVALLMSLQPVLVALIVPRWSGEHVGARQWLGLALGLLGAAVVIAARSTTEPPTLFGFVCVFAGLAGITGGSLWEKRFGLSHHPVTANLVGYAAGLVGILPLMLFWEAPSVSWTWEFGAALAYLVIGNSVIAVGLLLAMIRADDVARVSALFFLVPPLAALIAWFMIGEIMPPLAWGGMAIAALGVFLATRKAKQAGG